MEEQTELTQKIVSHTTQFYAPFELWMPQYFPRHSVFSQVLMFDSDSLRSWIHLDDAGGKALLEFDGMLRRYFLFNDNVWQ